MKKLRQLPPHIHFIGIGGIGMSAIAMILAKDGYSIYVPCELGSYQPNSGQSSCIEAEPGFYVENNGSIDQIPCIEGTYNPYLSADSQDYCVQSNPGYHVPSPGSANQIPCIKGTYQPNFGESNCIPASLGYYVPVEGSISQIAAELDYYVDYIGSFTTNQCPELDATAGSINITGGTSGGRIAIQGTTTSAGAGLAELFGYWDTNKVAGIVVLSGADTSNKDDGHLAFYTSSSGPSVTERLRITSNGQIEQYANAGDNQFVSKRIGNAGSNGDYFFHLFAKNNGGTNVGGLGIVRHTGNDNSRMTFHTANGGTNKERACINR